MSNFATDYSSLRNLKGLHLIPNGDLTDATWIIPSSLYNFQIFYPSYPAYISGTNVGSSFVVPVGSLLSSVQLLAPYGCPTDFFTPLANAILSAIANNPIPGVEYATISLDSVGAANTDSALIAAVEAQGWTVRFL